MIPIYTVYYILYVAGLTDIGCFGAGHAHLLQYNLKNTRDYCPILSIDERCQELFIEASPNSNLS